MLGFPRPRTRRTRRTCRTCRTPPTRRTRFPSLRDSGQENGGGQHEEFIEQGYRIRDDHVQEEQRTADGDDGSRADPGQDGHEEAPDDKPHTLSVTRRTLGASMRLNFRAFGAIALIVLAQARGSAIVADVTDADVQRAVTIAMGSRDARARFHAPYVLPIKDPTVERVEVITEFRRFVLASEEQASRGNWMVARGGHNAKGQTLKDMVEKWRGQVAIRVTVRFHPQHRYSTVPVIDIFPGEPTLVALDVVRTPILSLNDAQAQMSVMTGATIETTFGANAFGDRSLPVRVVFEGKEIARVTADFARLE
jgi:hypothetical protein